MDRGRPKAFPDLPDTRSCVHCGSDYTRTYQTTRVFAARKFCCRECQFGFMRGKRHPNYVEPTQKLCMNCGTPISYDGLGHKSALNFFRKGKFCSACVIRMGDRNPAWIGGISKTRDGYLQVGVNGGPRAYVHRLIVEKVLGRKLRRFETVHHINGDNTDNRNCNLMVCTQSYHKWLHNDMSRRYAQEHFGVKPAGVGIPSPV